MNRSIVINETCNPPTANHQHKKIVRVGNFSKLADTPKLRSAIEFWTELLKDHRPETPFEGPVSFEMTLSYPWLKSEKKANLVKGRIFKCTQPDLDNIEKTVIDVLGKLAFFKNDSQIAIKRTRKIYSNAPGISITLEEMIDDYHIWLPL